MYEISVEKSRKSMQIKNHEYFEDSTYLLDFIILPGPGNLSKSVFKIDQFGGGKHMFKNIFLP